MSAGRALARGGLLVGGAILVSRVLGFVRIFAITSTTHDPASLDPFFQAFRVPDLIFQLVAAGALSSAVIPMIATLLAADEQARAWRVVSAVTNLMLVALAVLAGGLMVFAPEAVRAITPGFTGERLAQTVELTRIMLLSPILLALGSVATSVLNAGGRFTASVIAPIVYNVAIIGGAVFLAGPFGLAGIAVSVVIGSVFHLAIQLPSLFRDARFRYTPTLARDDPETRQTILLLVPRVIGLGGAQLQLMAATAIGSLLAAGTITAFTVAFTVFQIPIGVIGLPLGIVALPTLSAQVASGAVDEFVDLVGRSFRLMAFVMLPLTFFGIVAAGPIMDVLFGLGRTPPDQLDGYAAVLAAFLVALPSETAIVILARAFYAMRDTRTPVAAALLAVVVSIAISILVAPALGAPGLALGIAIASWFETVALVVLLDRRVPALHVGALVRAIALFAACGALAGATLWAVLAGAHAMITPGPGRLVSVIANALELAVGGLAGGLVYLGLARFLRIPEVPTIVHLLRSALRRDARRSPPRDRGAAARRAGRLGRLRGRERARLVPPAHRLGARQGGQRVDERARRGRGCNADRGAGPPPPAAPAALGVRVRAARPGGHGVDRGVAGRLHGGPAVGTLGRVSHVRIDPEVERDGPLDPGGSLREILARAGWRPAPPIQPPSTRLIDLAAGEDALWSDLRKKWRQYVNKARSNGVTVVELPGDPIGPFYAIYRETAARAGFLIRVEQAYRDVWDAYRPTGDATILFAIDADGTPQAALFLVRNGRRVVEPYGGHDGRRRGPSRQLPAQVGSDPARQGGRRWNLRPVGTRAPGDRPLQDGLRGSRGPLRRGLGPGPERARPADLPHGPASAGSSGRDGGPAWRPPARRAWREPTMALPPTARTSTRREQPGPACVKPSPARSRAGTTGRFARPAGMSSNPWPGASTARGRGGAPITSRSTMGARCWRWGGRGRCSAAGGSTCRRDRSRPMPPPRWSPIVSPRWRTGRARRATTRSSRMRRSPPRPATPRPWPRAGSDRSRRSGLPATASRRRSPPAPTTTRCCAVIATTTRQLIVAAERRGMRIVRHDAAAATGPGPGFEAPVAAERRLEAADEAATAAFERFHGLLARDGRAARIRDRAARGRARLVARRAGGRPPRAPRGALRGRRLPGRRDLLPERRAAHLCPFRRRGRAAARAARRRPACSSGARSSWRPARVAPSWTSAASTWPARDSSPARAMRCTACSSSSDPSAADGSSWPAPTSGSCIRRAHVPEQRSSGPAAACGAWRAVARPGR